MGSNNSVQININLDRSHPFYLAGETVSGTVDTNVLESSFKIDEIVISLRGESGYTTTRTVSQGNGSSRTETDYHTITFLKEKQILEKSGVGGKELVYHAGRYSWPFNFQLPNDVPPSLNEPQSYPRVRYYIKFVIDKPWYKRDPNQTLHLIVYPHVNISSNPSLLSPSIFGNHNRKEVTLSGNVQRLAYLPGETISGMLEIRNPERITLKQIHLNLIRTYQIHPNTKKEKVVETLLPGVVNTKQEWMSQPFSLTIPPISLPPSYQFHAGYCQNTNVSSGYLLEFEVKASGFFTNFDVDIPITIGTESGTHEKSYPIDPGSNFMPNTLSFYPQSIGFEEQPPSYH